MSKYELHFAEDRFQPGSNETVLANKPGITNEHEMDALESGLLLMLYEHLFTRGQQPVILTFEQISHWHRLWLGNVYPWAGCLRSANLTKSVFSLLQQDGSPTLFAILKSSFSLTMAL